MGNLYVESLQALECGFLDTVDIEPYIQTICQSLKRQIPQKLKFETLECMIQGYSYMDYYIAFEKAINYIKAWDKLKEKINQLQTYKLFNNDKETYLSKQDVIDLVSEIEREVNNE